MAQLPPRVPNMAAIWPQFSPQAQKKIIMSPMDDPSWADEFLDFSTKRGSHRRSMSDSVAFLDIPLMAAEEEECRRRSSIIPGSSNGGLFEKFDDDEQQQQQQQQLMSTMFNRDDNMIMGSGGGGGGPNSSDPSSPSDFNNMNIDDEDDDEKEVPSDQHLRMQQQMMMKNEPDQEDESSCKSDQGLFQAHAHNGIMDNNNSSDKIIDPKRIKRILANRQSAQRSRVRKLQYVSELERSVTSLQAEISVLSPRVAYLDHQRLILGVDNGVLKQRIAALAQDKIFKDAHQEALKMEIERLRQVYNYQQNLNKKDNEPHINSQTSPRPAAVNGYAEKEQLVN